jgi:hypothetical protein
MCGALQRCVAWMIRCDAGSYPSLTCIYAHYRSFMPFIDTLTNFTPALITITTHASVLVPSNKVALATMVPDQQEKEDAACVAWHAPPHSSLTMSVPSHSRSFSFVHSLGGMCGTVVTSPFDVVKTRLQSDLFRQKHAGVGAVVGDSVVLVRRAGGFL